MTRIWSVFTCDESILLPFCGLSDMSFDIITEDIIGVDSLNIWMFALESAISSVYFLGELGGVPILLIKLILGVLVLILFIIYPNYH